MTALTCVLQMVRRDVLAGFHVITLFHTEYSGRSHSFAQGVLNNSVLCTLWLQDVMEIQPVDPVNLSGVQSENIHIIKILPIILLWCYSIYSQQAVSFTCSLHYICQTRLATKK